MIWEIGLYVGSMKVGDVKLCQAPRVDQIVRLQNKRYRILDHTWESIGVLRNSGDPDFIGAAAVEETH